MGIESSRYAWSVDNLEPTSKLVLVCLSSFAKDCGCCYPSTRLIGKLTNLAQRTVQHHIKRLTENGAIVRTKRGKGRKHSGFQLQTGLSCSVSGCVSKASPVASTISISKDIDTRTKNIELADGVSLFKTPEWLEIIDLTTDVNLVENVEHLSVRDYINEIEMDFENVDLLAEAKKYHLWWEGKKAKKPKLAFRNWLEKASKYGETNKRVSKGVSIPVGKEIDNRTREISERQKQNREN
jgi:DNA-binding transcriptional ArsR family regulator|tara:strand:+ start:175 stop:891 length:717 start_codon:yes stop_codon:yes gene_type:complete